MKRSLTELANHACNSSDLGVLDPGAQIPDSVI